MPCAKVPLLEPQSERILRRGVIRCVVAATGSTYLMLDWEVKALRKEVLLVCLPTALTAHQRAEALQRLANGDAQADVARTFNVSQATISRLVAT